ncbi:hypothetical protein UMZ34_20660 [Halopseudomonas pachastrellae]|nr:hypothetical protein UMZ34_20660 [Halopseudomonas pachastrellae]
MSDDDSLERALRAMLQDDTDNHLDAVMTSAWIAYCTERICTALP